MNIPQPEEDRLEAAQASDRLHFDPILPANSTHEYLTPDWAPEREADPGGGHLQWWKPRARAWGGTRRLPSPLSWTHHSTSQSFLRLSCVSNKDYSTEANFHPCCNSNETDEDESTSLSSQVCSETSNGTSYSSTPVKKRAAPWIQKQCRKVGPIQIQSCPFQGQDEPPGSLLGFLTTISSNLSVPLSQKLQVNHGSCAALTTVTVFHASAWAEPCLQQYIWHRGQYEQLSETEPPAGSPLG